MVDLLDLLGLLRRPERLPDFLQHLDFLLFKLLLLPLANAVLAIVVSTEVGVGWFFEVPLSLVALIQIQNLLLVLVAYFLQYDLLKVAYFATRRPDSVSWA